MEEVERAVIEPVDFIEVEEPQLLSYGFHIDEETSRMTVVAIHPTRHPSSDGGFGGVFAAAEPRT